MEGADESTEPWRNREFFTFRKAYLVLQKWIWEPNRERLNQSLAFRDTKCNAFIKQSRN